MDGNNTLSKDTWDVMETLQSIDWNLQTGIMEVMPAYGKVLQDINIVEALGALSIRFGAISGHPGPWFALHDELVICPRTT